MQEGEAIVMRKSRCAVTTRAVLDSCNAYIKLQGAVRCLFLTSPAILRLVRRYGFDPVACGPIVDNGDGKFLAFECPVR